MNEFLKKNKGAIIIVIATLVLAGVAIFTAIKLYELRQTPVAPNAPEKPQAATSSSCQALSFTLVTPSPSPTPAVGCYNNCAAPGSQSNCPTGMQCQTIGGNNICVNPSCSGNSNCICNTATPTPTPTPVPQCGSTCSTNSDCANGMTCSGGVCKGPSCATPTPTPTPVVGCYSTCTNAGTQDVCPSGMQCQTVGGVNRCVNPSCASSSSCVCATATPTPTVTPVPTLPTSGVSTPTLLGVAIAAFLVLGSLVILL